MRAVILAGGKGTRLYPYTVTFPKPLVPIGDVPILEILLRQLKHAGFTRITMAVGHLAGLIEAYFGDGRKFGLEVTYSREDKPLGTAGPLKLIDGLKGETFLVLNGDILTTIDFMDFWNYHHDHGGTITIASHERDVNIDLGVMVVDSNNLLTEYIEKPTYHYRVSMGIYMFSPAALELIPDGRYFDFPELVLKLLEKQRPVATYPFEGHWLDIGRPDDFALAAEQFQRLRHEFLPSET